jgi:hypothetical protein
MKYLENVVFMTLLWDVCNVIGYATILLSSGINDRSSKIMKNASEVQVFIWLVTLPVVDIMEHE